MKLAALLALALLALPTASAHFESYSQSKALQAGPFLVYFEPRPSPPYANNSVSMVAQISDAGTGALLRNQPATVIVGGPDEYLQRKNMEPDGTGYLIASFLIPQRGNYSARILIRDANTNETHAVDAELEVFPDIAYRIRPVDAALDVYTGQRLPMAFEIYDPITLAPKDTLADLKVRVEHWSDDHVEFRGAEEVPATRAASATWRIDHTFQSQGMYHLRFGSEAGGFNYADVPLLHVYAVTPQDAGIEEKETPGPALALLLVLLALVALRKR